METSQFVEVDMLKIGDAVWRNVEIEFGYSENWHPIFDLTPFTREILKGKRSAQTLEGVAIVISKGQTQTDLHITELPIILISDDQKILATSLSEPISLGMKSECKSLKFVVLGPPRVRQRRIRLVDRRGQTFTMNFDVSEADFVTVDANLEDNRDVVASLDDLIEFMTFVKGAYCGVGHGVGTNTQGKICVEVLGFTRHDTTRPQRNWFDHSIQGQLPKIFSKFSFALENRIRRQAIRQAVGFYRASNEARDVSVELAIISSHTALEATVYYILEHMAGWSKKLSDDRRIAFSDKLRAAVAYLRIDAEIDTYSPSITKLISSTQNVNDAFEALCYVRNKLVHQDQNYAPEGVQLHETWLVLQWLVEVLIFGICGYSGDLVDRRAYTGWVGTKFALSFHS